MCYNSCEFFQTYSERCTKPSNLPCPEYCDDDEFEEALKNDEFERERALELKYGDF